MSAAPLVLVADDDEDIRRLVALRLGQAGLRVALAANGDEALALAQSERPDLLLLDVSMPGRDGYAVCAALAELETTPPPVIFLTAHGHVAARVRGLEAGAVDYVTKPFDAHELLARVRAALRTKAERDELERAALLDRLTGLPNRRALDARLEEAVAAAVRFDRALACTLLDVDDFKRINDACGHAAGDAVLAEVASRLHAAARASDVVARYGGDEFVVVLDGAGRDAALRAAERLRRAVCEHEVPIPGGARVPVSISVGVALHEPGMTPATLCAAADLALYAAKREGKNTVALHSLAA